MEQKYQLTKDDNPEKLNFRFSNSSKDLKQNLENLYAQLNRMEFISSNEMYDQALTLFNVEIRKSGRGYSVFVSDENEIPVRHPVRMGDFEERPKFYLSEQRILGQQLGMYSYSEITEQSTGVLKSLILKELMQSTHFYNEEYQGKNRQKIRMRKNRGNGFKK